MKRLTYTLFILCVASLASATSIHVEWGYTPPDTPALAGFRLYQNGSQVQDWMDPAATSGDAAVTPLIVNVFTLTALFDDASESPHSAPYLWTDGATVIFFHHWLWFFKPSHKKTRVGATGLTGARLR